MEKIVIDAKLENLPVVTDFIIDSLESRNCSMKVKMQLELVIEEIFVNVANYAYKSEENGKVTICKEFDDEPQAITLTFKDSGKPYDPLQHKDPDITLSAEERNIGGLGIFLVKKNVDEIYYKYEDGQNILTVKKLF